MKILEISILETHINANLAKEYISQPIVKCPEFKVGQKFILSDFQKPEKFCTWAWQDIFYVVHTLWNDGTFFPWYKDKNVVIAYD